MRILGIETSADETAAAVVEDGQRLLSNAIGTSANLQTFYGGIVPEIAARSHLEVIIPVVEEALKTAKAGWADIDGIAVSCGPGLAGSLLIGVMTAKSLAQSLRKPLYGINHVQAHPYAAFITKTALPGYKLPPKQPQFPFLALSVSGGHSSLILFKSHKRYTVLGQTNDDAVGEAFDKVAKMLGLPYPGGPPIAELAAKGNALKYRLPKPKLKRKYDFSFSGLKTAVLRLAQEETGHNYTFPSSALPEALSESQKRDIAASFQHIAVESLVDKLKLAVEEFQPKSVVVAGGVAANSELRRQASAALNQTVIYPDIKLCTDNAAMIATLAYFTKPQTDLYKLTVEPSLGL